MVFLLALICFILTTCTLHFLFGLVLWLALVIAAVLTLLGFVVIGFEVDA